MQQALGTHVLLGHVLAPRLATAASSQSVREYKVALKAEKGKILIVIKKKLEITFIMCMQRSGRGAQDPNFQDTGFLRYSLHKTALSNQILNI